MNRCKEYSEHKKEEIRQQLDQLSVLNAEPAKPVLAVIQVGNNPASNSYIKGKRKDCEEVGIECKWVSYPETITQLELVKQIHAMNMNEAIHGIIVQLPLPDHIDVHKIQEVIASNKDVDGFSQDSPFEPCTPLGVINYMKYCGYSFDGKMCTVIGRSDIVGRPLARMLERENATVLMAHSHTPERVLQASVKISDYVFTCIDKIEYYNQDNLDLKLAQAVIDVGLGRGLDGKLHGNLDKEYVRFLEVHNLHIAHHAGELVSGTGGVGLLTRVTLLENVMKAYRIQTD